MYRSAKDLENGVQELIRQNIGSLPPTEQGKVSQDLMRMMRTVSAGKKLYTAAFDLREPREAYQVEKLLNDPEVTVVQSSISFSPIGEMIYALSVEVSPGHYDLLREEFIEEENEVANPPVKPSLWQRFLGLFRDETTQPTH
jgi:hypothetical protein